MLVTSGHGQITRVDVSKDGGKTWQTARLAKPGEKMALTRFYLDTDWSGEDMLLQSRAIDETGYVQPTKAQLREETRAAMADGVGADALGPRAVQGYFSRLIARRMGGDLAVDEGQDVVRFQVRLSAS